MLPLQEEVAILQAKLKEGTDELQKLCNTLETRDQELQGCREQQTLLHDDIKSAQLHSEKLQTQCDEQGKYSVVYPV